MQEKCKNEDLVKVLSVLYVLLHKIDILLEGSMVME